MHKDKGDHEIPKTLAFRYIYIYLSYYFSFIQILGFTTIHHTIKQTHRVELAFTTMREKKLRQSNLQPRDIEITLSGYGLKYLFRHNYIN
jgi:hypothetical protein